MKRYPWLTAFFIFFSVLYLSSQVFAEKELYDDFSGTYIDSQKWNQCEFVREVSGSKLISKLGNTGGYSRNGTGFQAPETIMAIECEIAVVATNLDTGNNPISFVRIGGFFYNTQPSGGATGDVWAEVQIGDRGNGLEAFWEVEEALDDDGNNWSTIGSGTLIGPGTLTYGTAYSAKIQYDANNVIEFIVDGVGEIFSGPVRRRAELTQYKQLATGIDADGGSGNGFVHALFDNVHINNETTPYDTFDTEPLDHAKWEDPEQSREIGPGKLHLGVRASDEWACTDLSLTRYNTSYLEAKALIESGSHVSSGGFGLAKIAGWYYNTSHGPGSGRNYNGNEGDVFVQNRIKFDENDNLKASAQVWRSDDASHSTGTTLFFGEFSTPISFDTEYTLSIEFSPSELIFKCNSETLNHYISTPIYEPYDKSRVLRSRIRADPGEFGDVKVQFDDVYIAEDIDFCQGNFDTDGDVDGSDLAVFAADFGRTDCSGDCKGDFDGDGDVDGSDLAVFAADFGRTNCP